MKGVHDMKNRMLRAIAALALTFATLTAMSVSHFFFYEPEMPEALKAMKK